MQQLTYVSFGQLHWEDVAAPVLSERSAVLVRPFVVARSDLDTIVLTNNLRRQYQRKRLLRQLDSSVSKLIRRDPFKGPFAIGQECVAQVVETGPDVKGLSQGQVVIVPSQLSCGRCTRCRAGITSHCEEHGALAYYGGIGRNRVGNGMLCDLVLIPNAERFLVPVPDDLDPITIGSAAGNLTEAWTQVSSLLLQQPGKRVLIIGGSARSTALYAVAFATSMDTAQLDYVDLSGERVAIAGQLGARAIEIDYRRHRGQYDVVICANSHKRAVSHALSLLEPGGVCSAIHMPLSRSPKVPLFKMLSFNLTLKAGLPNLQPNISPMLDYLRSTGVQIRPVNTHVAEFDLADQHFQKRTTKVIVHRPRL